MSSSALRTSRSATAQRSRAPPPRYPQFCSTPASNDLVNSPNQRDLTVPLPQPFVSASSRLPAMCRRPHDRWHERPVSSDAVRRSNAPANSPAVSFAATSFHSRNQTASARSNPATAPLFTSFSVLPSTNAGFNGGAGVKAQLDLEHQRHQPAVRPRGLLPVDRG